MTQVFVALGSNVEPEKNVPLALTHLLALFPNLKISPVYRCAPIGFSGAYFWNLVVSFSFEPSVEVLADCLRALEFELGREADAQKNAPRTIDIDILLFGNAVGKFGRVSLPRADILNYAFVLKPLAELAPDFIHPIEMRSLHSIYLSSKLNFNDMTLVKV